MKIENISYSIHTLYLLLYIHVLTEFNNLCISVLSFSSKHNYPVSGWCHTPLLRENDKSLSDSDWYIKL